MTNLPSSTKYSKQSIFLNGSIFYAKVSFGSYVWQSILKARRVKTNGMQWRIGDGEIVRIYEDYWLSTKLASPRGNFPAGATVSQLLEPETGGWNVPLIENDFLPFEAQKILAIPLCMTRQQDITIWPRCKTARTQLKQDTSFSMSWMIGRGHQVQIM